MKVGCGGVKERGVDWFGVAAFLSTGDYQSVAGNVKQDSLPPIVIP